MPWIGIVMWPWQYGQITAVLGQVWTRRPWGWLPRTNSLAKFQASPTRQDCGLDLENTGWFLPAPIEPQTRSRLLAPGVMPASRPAHPGKQRWQSAPHLGSHAAE